jgi:spore germination protein
MSERRLTRRGVLGALAAGLLGPRRSGAAAAPRRGLVRHFYWVNGASPIAMLGRQATSIDLVSPQWFHLLAGGRVRADIDQELVAVAAEQGIPLMPLVVNDGFRPDVAADVLEREKAWNALGDELSSMAVAYGMRGLQVDFEGLSARSREPYARFVGRLARALRPRGLACTVAVGAPLASSPDGAGRWPDSPHAPALDYAALARAVDSVTVMTYDQHAAPGDPGPVAGRPWVEACLRRLLELVPASRLLLGVPLYYRRWSGDTVVEGSHAEAVALAERVGVPVRLDSGEGEKTYEFVERGIRNVVWLQDRDTLRERVGLARRFGLRGFSAWRLGHEDRALWTPSAGLAEPDQRTNRTSQR